MKCVNEHRITSFSCAAGCGWLCAGDDTGLLAQMAVVQGSKRPNIGKTKTPCYNLRHKKKGLAYPISGC